MKVKYCVLFLAALVVSCTQSEKQSGKLPIRVQVEKISADSASMVLNRPYVGIIEAKKSTAVSFTGMGVVSKVCVEEGQAVGRGQLLAVLDGTQSRNMLMAAEAQMAQANDALARYTKLHDNGSLSELQWAEILSKVAQAKSQLAIARKNVADCRLTAPVSGVVGRRMVNAGESAMPSQAIVTILDISQVNVKVSVPEREMPMISSSTPSKIYVKAVDEEYVGGKIEKGVSADAITHTYEIRVTINNPARRLLPGMVADVTLGLSDATPGNVTVPVTSVQKSADGTFFVWTVDNAKKAVRTTVCIGETVGNRIEVLSGLTTGATVVVEGYQKLSAGVEVVY